MPFHPRNTHQGKYDLEKYCSFNDKLSQYIVETKAKTASINFLKPEAVYQLNRSILLSDYSLQYWDIPKGNLCPPIPSRADYIHHLADLLALSNRGKIPKGSGITVLDIGTGSSCVYPIVGVKSYQWNFIGTDIHKNSIASANKIIESNQTLKGKIEIRKQLNPQNIFKDVILENEFIDLTICNPPFHSNQNEAIEASERKIKNLGGDPKTALNFGGKSNELWCEGGELSFIERMIKESKFHKKNVMWFSTLVSKQTNIKALSTLFKNHSVEESETLIMDHGNKKSRFVVWTFLTEAERLKWAKIKWK